MLVKLYGIVLLGLLALAPLVAFGKADLGRAQQGVASLYSDSFHGRKTASGERYDRTAMTAAHKSLPLGTEVRVTRIKTGDSVVVRINDRGPFIKGRIIDLSRRAARELGIIQKGTAQVRVEVVSRPGDDGA